MPVKYLKRLLSESRSTSSVSPEPEFTEDWTTNKLDLWLPILEPLRDLPLRIRPADPSALDGWRFA